MKDNQPSDTYKYLYKNIIENLFYQICNSNINYCIRYRIGQDEIHIAIWKKYKEYRDRALANMSSTRLDRHKLASCICGAIIETKPLVGYNGATILKNANEIFALYVGLNVIKAFMQYDIYARINDSSIDKTSVYSYLKTKFNMQLPSMDKNICDIQEYRDNIVNALYWSHHNCKFKDGNCFHYDIWAYSKIFYHLEMYNQKYIENAYQEYLKCNQNG